MRASPSSALSPELPPPTPSSSVEELPEPITIGSPPPDPSRRGAERKAALLDYFTDPSPEMREMDAAWEQALALYGDEDSDAWVSALEDGTHPLCRVRTLQRSA